MMGIGTRILMVGNNPEDLRDRAGRFTRLGFAVTTAESSFEAIEATTRADFDVAEISLDSATAANLRSYLERRYHTISVFVVRPPTCRSPGPRRPPRCPTSAAT